jgi:hypothetical protein
MPWLRQFLEHRCEMAQLLLVAGSGESAARTMTGVVAALAFLCIGAADAQVQIPKELDGWRDWVLNDQDYRRCPFLANSDGTREEDRICAWPGRLGLDVTDAGAHFTQSWVRLCAGLGAVAGQFGALAGCGYG